MLTLEYDQSTHLQLQVNEQTNKYDIRHPRRNKMSSYVYYNPNGYNPSTGIYASSQIFTGNWENELEALNFTPKGKTTDEHINAADVDKHFDGEDVRYLFNSFKSEDGLSTTTEIADFWEEENPENFSYTDSYYNSPKLAAIIDWFQCEKTRCRIFQQQPHTTLDIHTDFDNQRGNEHGETLRIFVQLNDMPGGAWFRFKTEDTEVSINLQKGQFLIFNPDHTGHGTENITDIPRNTFMLVVKRNEWIDNLVGDKNMKFIDINEAVAKQNKVIAA